MAEWWHLDPELVKRWPASRRIRYLLKKKDLEEERQRRSEEQANRVRSRSRR